jgi:adenosylcobinamide-GDP ribazoletransferase
MVAMPYAGSSAVTKSEDVRRAQGLQAVFGSVVTVLVLAAAVPAFGLAPSRIAAVLVLGGVATGFLAWRFWRRLGGITGDFLGATEQALELTGLAVFCWGLS